MRRAVALFLVGCGGPEPAPARLPTGSEATFAASVQPVLDRSCADPSCHGEPGRPFSVYSPRRYRMDPSRLFLDEPLTDEELQANMRQLCASAFAARVAGEPLDGCQVLCKPLAPDAGGCFHEGGVLFDSRDERPWRALRAWLAALDWSGP